MFIGKMAQKTITIGIGGEKDGSNGFGINSFKLILAKSKNHFSTL